jgi:methylated-DNA-[protein]-cysteine S-methyltransferase
MEMKVGTCRFGLWYVIVHWEGNTVYRVRFSRYGEESPVPPSIRLYLAGRTREMELESIATRGTEMFAQIYREVRKVPYAGTATYGEIAKKVGTGPRVVGMAMARNPTPIIIPCHRIVGARGLGGFSSGLALKSALLEMERNSRP